MTQPPEDEWFAPTEPSEQGGQRQPTEDEWLADRPAARPPAFDPWALVNGPLIALVALVVVFLVALVAAFGAFDSSGPANGGAVAVVTQQAPAHVPAATTTVAVTPPSSSVAPTITLKPGDSGAQVKALQRELTSLGFPVGTIDGSYGAATTKAVAAFQKAHHLTADGVVGPATLTALAP